MATRYTNQQVLRDELPRKSHRTHSSTSPRRELRSNNLPFRGKHDRMSFDDYERWDRDYSQSNQLAMPDTNRPIRDRGRSPGSPVMNPLKRKTYAVESQTRQRDSSLDSLDEWREDYSRHMYTRRSAEGSRSGSPEDFLQRYHDKEGRHSAERIRPPENSLRRNLRECIEELKTASLHAARSGEMLSAADDALFTYHKPAIGGLNGVASRLEEQALRLDIWSHEADIDAILAADVGASENEMLAFVGSVLERLLIRVRNVQSGCEAASPDDFDQQAADQHMSDDDMVESSDDEGEGIVTVSEGSLGFDIEQDVRGIELQVRTLRTLTRAVKGTQPDEHVQARIVEIKKYFGTEKDCKVYHVDPDYSGHKALVEARKIEAKMRETLGSRSAYARR